MIERLVSLIAPHNCIVCKEEGRLLCDWCSPDAIQTVPSRCYGCYAVSADSAVCSKCRSRSPLGHVWVRSVYADTARELVYRLKFERAKAAAELIASQLDETLPYLESNTVITYVPTATSRVRIRGYDHSKLIAKRLARKRKLACKPLLIRLGQSRQVRSSRTARAAQAETSYRVRKIHLAITSVLLIDDIVTTGATIEANARILRKAGIKHVNAAVFAQKQ